MVYESSIQPIKYDENCNGHDSIAENGYYLIVYALNEKHKTNQFANLNVKAMVEIDD